MNHKFCELLE